MSTNPSASDSDSNDSYAIRRHRGAARYRVSCPVGLAEDAGIEHKDKLGVRVEIEEDGDVTIVYSTNPNPEDTTISALVTTLLDLSIPWSIVLTGQLDGVHVTWDLNHVGDGEYELRADVDQELPNVSYLVGSASVLTDRDGPTQPHPLGHVERSVEKEEGTVKYEYYRVYLNGTQVDDLGWDEVDEVAIVLSHVNGNPTLLFTTDTTNVNEKVVKELQPSNKRETSDEDDEDRKQDAVLYVPGALVRSLGLSDKTMAWLNADGDLVLTPS